PPPRPLQQRRRPEPAYHGAGPRAPRALDRDVGPRARRRPALGLPRLPRRDPAHDRRGRRLDRERLLEPVRVGRPLADRLRRREGRDQHALALDRDAVRAAGDPLQRRLARADPHAGLRPRLSAGGRRRPRPPHPAGRPGARAPAVLFLAWDGASYVPGQIRRVDGGPLAHMPHYAMLTTTGATPTRRG